MRVEIEVALIAAATSAVITPFIQLLVDALKGQYKYKQNIAPINEHVRILNQELLQLPINPNIKGIPERISTIENFYDPIFNSVENHYVKINFINKAKDLEARHKYPRPWMEIEYPEECQIFNNLTERLLAVLNKEKKIPDLFDPSE